MNHYPASIRRVINNFAKLPGIGAKTAERLAMHLLNTREELVLELSKSIGELKKALESDDKDQIEQKMKDLTQASHQLAEIMYKDAQQNRESDPGSGQTPPTQPEPDKTAGGDDVVDAEFEESN